MTTTITKVLSVAHTRAGNMRLVDYDGHDYEVESMIRFNLFDPQIGDEFVATIDVAIADRGSPANDFADDYDGRPNRPISRMTDETWEVIVALQPVAQEDILRQDAFEILVVMPGRLEAPKRWRELRQSKPGRTMPTEHGIMLTIETPLLAEVERLRRDIQKQSWIKDVSAIFVRRVTRITRWFPIPPDQLAQASRLPEGPIHYFAASCGVIEQPHQELPPAREPLALPARESDDA
jgi:hypothetical protein